MIFIINKDCDLFIWIWVPWTGSEKCVWLESLNHALWGLHEKCDFSLFFNFCRVFECLFKLWPLFLVSLAKMASKMGGFVILAIAEHVWAFEQVLALMAQFTSCKLDMASELLRAVGALQVASGHAIEPVFAVLRDVRGDGHLVPVLANPVWDFW